MCVWIDQYSVFWHENIIFVINHSFFVWIHLASYGICEWIAKYCICVCIDQSTVFSFSVLCFFAFLNTSSKVQNLCTRSKVMCLWTKCCICVFVYEKQSTVFVYLFRNNKVLYYEYIFEFNAREASWRRGFDPYAPLQFNLYHYLEQNLHFGLVPENQFWVSRGRY